MLNVYTVIRVDGPGTIRVRRDVRDCCQPEVGDVVFLSQEPVAKVLTCTIGGADTFDIVFDRNARVLIASLVAIGVP